MESYLMHHYTLDTCKSMMYSDHSLLVFQQLIPEVAMTQPHVTRGVLAVSACHLAYQKSSENSLWMKLAIKNQIIASAALRQALTGITMRTVRGCLYCQFFLVSPLLLQLPGWNHLQ